MKYDLKKPCKNCPFRNDATRITFAARERAEEIEESAYRYGFPCHKSAELADDGEDTAGYVPGPKSQHCVGYAIMQLNEGGNSPWPGIGNSQRVIDRIDRRVDLDTRRLVFHSSEEFFAANPPAERRRKVTSRKECK